MRYADSDVGKDDPLLGSGILFLCQGRLLVVRRAPDETAGGLWSIPGGHIKHTKRGGHKHPWGSAKREAKEELGSLPPGMFRARRKHTLTEKNSDKTYITYIVELPPSAMKWNPTLGPDHDAHRWVNKAQAKKLKLHPGLAKVLKNPEVWQAKFYAPLTVALQRYTAVQATSLGTLVQKQVEAIDDTNEMAEAVFQNMAKDLRFIRLDLVEVMHGPPGYTPVAGVFGVMRDAATSKEMYFDVSVSPRDEGKLRVLVQCRRSGQRKAASFPQSIYHKIPSWVKGKLEAFNL